MTKPRLLWVGDAGVPSGFAKATHKILETLHRAFDVTVLGMNYRGDPHEYPYPIYAAAVEGDAMGVLRVAWMCHKTNPDVIILQNDGWNIPFYVSRIRKQEKYANVPIVAAVAVDGKNFQGEWLDGVSLAIFWTHFALTEARAGGYRGPAAVIPLGVDLEVYKPGNQKAARQRRGLCHSPSLEHSFIVGNVNRNQPRKRWDLTIKYFAEWVHSYDVKDAALYLHTAPTGDDSMKVEQLAKYYDILDQVALFEPPMWYGISEQEMCDTYNVFDVQVSTTQGEGFGLTPFEGMACGIPQIMPSWSALGELLPGAGMLVECTSTAIGAPYVNVIGGVADELQFIRSLQLVYSDLELRKSLKIAALLRVHEPRFRWEVIGQEWLNVLNWLISSKAPVEAAEVVGVS